MIKEGHYIRFGFDKKKKQWRTGKVTEVDSSKKKHHSMDVLTILLDKPETSPHNGIPDRWYIYEYRHACMLDVQRNREERLKKLLDDE